jgi:hypothetical protein
MRVPPLRARLTTWHYTPPPDHAITSGYRATNMIQASVSAVCHIIYAARQFRQRRHNPYVKASSPDNVDRMDAVVDQLARQVTSAYHA